MPPTFLSARQLFSVPLDLLQLELNSDVTLGALLSDINYYSFKSANKYNYKLKESRGNMCRGFFFKFFFIHQRQLSPSSASVLCSALVPAGG